MKCLSIPKQLLLISAFIILTGIGIGCSVAWQIENSVAHQTARTTALYVASIISPHLQRLGSADALTAAETAQLQDLLKMGAFGQQIVSFKIWNAQGRVLYGSDSANVGRTFRVDGGLATAWQGTTSSRVSDLKDEENVGERTLASRLMETYSPVYAAGTDRVIAVAEFYQKADVLEVEIGRIQFVTWLLLGAVVLLWVYFMVQEVLSRVTVSHRQHRLT